MNLVFSTSVSNAKNCLNFDFFEFEIIDVISHLWSSGFSFFHFLFFSHVILCSNSLAATAAPCSPFLGDSGLDGGYSAPFLGLLITDEGSIFFHCRLHQKTFRANFERPWLV